MLIVTGANGFIGSAMVRELNTRGRTDIICVDVIDLKERPEPLSKSKYDRFMTTPQFLKWCQTGSSTQNIDGLFHMGAISSTTETDWAKLKATNIELSQRLFQFCAEKNIPFIYASSGAVYGLGENGFNDDLSSEKLNPLNLYGRSKKEFDIWVKLQQPRSSQCIGLRFFNVYGPNEYHKNDMASVAHKAFLQIKESGRLKLFRSYNDQYADGEQLRDFVYVKDITRWMWEIFESPLFPSGIYNLGFGKARSWLDLAESVFAAMELQTRIEWIDMPQALRDQYQYFTQADMTKAAKAGLSQPQYSLEDGLQDYFKNYLLSDDPYL